MIGYLLGNPLRSLHTASVIVSDVSLMCHWSVLMLWFILSKEHPWSVSQAHYWLEIMCCRNIHVIDFHDHDHSDMVPNNRIIHLGLITAAQECWCMLHKFYPVVSVTGSDASGKSFSSQLSCCITDAPSRMPDDYNQSSTLTETVTDGYWWSMHHHSGYCKE